MRYPDSLLRIILENLLDVSLGNNFLDMTLRAHTTKRWEVLFPGEEGGGVEYQLLVSQGFHNTGILTSFPTSSFDQSLCPLLKTMHQHWIQNCYAWWSWNRSKSQLQKSTQHTALLQIILWNRVLINYSLCWKFANTLQEMKQFTRIG